MTYVEFTNAENGPSPVEWIRPHHKEYALWTNDTIKVKVTSYGAYNPNWSYFGNALAGTGYIRVRTPNGISNQSSSILTVKYSIANVTVDNNNVFSPDKITFVDINNYGGYTLTFDTSFTNNISYPGAQAAFERALTTWRCETGVNFIINDTIPNQNGYTISVKFGTPLNGALAQTADWIIPDCVNNSYSYLHRFSITFNNNGYEWYTGLSTPAPLGFIEYDLETHALHELGHAHLLNHTNNINNTMWWFARDNNTPYFRYLDNEAKLGGYYVVDSIPNIISQTCGISMSKVDSTYCTIINPTKKSHSLSQKLLIYPNPTQEILNIEWSDYIINENYFISIIDLNGRVLHIVKLRTKQQQIDLSSIPVGMYFLIVRDDQRIVGTQKLIKN